MRLFKAKRLIAMVLVLSMLAPYAIAEDEQPKSIFDSIGGWFSHAAEDTAGWVTQAWDDASAWTTQALIDASQGVIQAWDASSKWVAQAWSDSGDWISGNWDQFIIWMNTVSTGNPYDWVYDMVGEDGLIAYDTFTSLRSFLLENPDLDAMHNYYLNNLGSLSILNEDKESIWSTLELWSEVKKLSVEKTAQILSPFLCRLLIRGGAAIGEDTVFSGPVVTKYLLTILESMNIDSTGTADMKLKILHSVLASLTRPNVIGDVEQNALVTEDGYYIENFTYKDNKYQIMMVATSCQESSEFPLIRGKTLSDIASSYFSSCHLSDATEETIASKQACTLDISGTVGSENIVGKAIAVWAEKYNYELFFLTNQVWSDAEYTSWLSTLDLSETNSISFEVDMESDGAFYGINRGAQAYTVKRAMAEARFLVPKTGHGWAAERGNNLIDNLKGFFKGEHAVVTGDNNLPDGADRTVTSANGNVTMIQTKYYADPTLGIDACFRDGKFRYMDSNGKPMKIEVPADQYDDAVRCMENRIRNNEVPNVTDPAEAKDIIKKGHLTYQQARHIAKAGTVESIAYDSIHSCVTAGTSMGLSAAVDLAIGLWNGQSFEDALRSSIYTGLKVGGITFVVSVFSSQLMKSGVNSALVPASEALTKALGSKTSSFLLQALTGKTLKGAAAMKSLARLLRSNTVISAVTLTVTSAGDIADIIQGKISWKQLAKNVTTTVAGIAGSSLGMYAGAAIGHVILPGAGGIVGIILASAAGVGASSGADALTDLIAEDDADEMIRIIESHFVEIGLEYFLTEDEANQAVTNLQALVTPNTLKEMFQYKDRDRFARQLIEMSIDPVVANRTYIDLPTEEEYSNYVAEVINELYEASEENTDE